MTVTSWIGDDLIVNNLPVLVADDDFIEHLHEHSFTETIDVGDLILEWNSWFKENVYE